MFTCMHTKAYNYKIRMMGTFVTVHLAPGYTTCSGDPRARRIAIILITEVQLVLQRCIRTFVGRWLEACLAHVQLPKRSIELEKNCGLLIRPRGTIQRGL